MLEAFPERTLMALRRRAEALTITRVVDNEITTRSLYAHYSIRDIEFLEEKEKEAERGVKGMDRISPTMCRSETLATWIGSVVTQPGHSEIASSTSLYSVYL
jgi:hypothetical protein